MKRFLAILLFLVLPLAARCAEEEQLMGVLQSDHSLKEKDAACARLKWIGTPLCVPVIEKLLTDPQLSQSARYALESLPGPEAGNALRRALAKTSGSNEVGIINSLGARGETTAGPDLAKLLANPDAAVAAAAAEALGRIGGFAAVKALQSAWSGSSTGPVHDAQSDSLLACANRLLTGGELAEAAEIFQSLCDREKVEHVRLAAFRGLILSSEKRGIALMVNAIKDGDGPSQGAALQLASTVGGPATTRALAALLPKLPASVQIAVLQALGQRRDRNAVSGVSEMFENTDPDVRVAAIATLGELRDGRAAMLLVRTATAATGAEKAAARQALQELYYGPVTSTLLDALPKAPPEMQLELIRALGDRGDASAAPKLLELAQGQNDLTRPAALQALALLAGPAQVPDLVQLVVKATNDDARSAAVDALSSACQHIQSQAIKMDATTLVAAVRFAPLEARVALLGVCSGVSGPQVRDVLHAALQDPDERVRVAAIRALCDSQDEQLLPDILYAARFLTDEKYRMLGLRGCVRLITQDQSPSLPVSVKIDTLNALVGANFNAAGKRLILSGLSSVADIQTLDLAATMLDDAEVKVEAAEAMVQIAKAVAVQHPKEAIAALNRVLAKPANEAVGKSAQAALKKIKSGK